jgi:phage N-6-adenine-methyltransferase
MNKETQKTMFSSKTGSWSTPQGFFDKLNWRFGPFDLDPCATDDNKKCNNFFTEGQDGLLEDWSGHTVFVNPPYGRGIEKWIEKGYRESLKNHTKIVMLVPSRTDTKYWHKYIMLASELYFVKGRLKFGESENSAPFPSAVVVFDGDSKQQVFGAMNR